MSTVELGPRTRLFECNACGQEFAWHPGTSGLSSPSGCGACDSADIHEIKPEPKIEATKE